MTHSSVIIALDQLSCDHFHSDVTSIFWNRTVVAESSESRFSILDYLESHSNQIRASYSCFVDSVSASFLRQFAGSNRASSPNPLALSWWTSRFVGKSNVSLSPQINDVLKIFAFQHWLDSNCQVSCITCIDIDRYTVSVLQTVARSKNIRFSSGARSSFRSFCRPKVRSFYEYLPRSTASLVSLLVYIYKRRNVIFQDTRPWQSLDGLIIINYLTSFNEFPSLTRFWGPLPAQLGELGVPAKWLHLYVPGGSGMLEISNKQVFTKSLNVSNESKPEHILLDSFIDMPMLLKLLRDWWKRLVASMHMTPRLGSLFLHRGADYSSFYLEELLDDLFGVPGMLAQLRFRMFDKLFSEEVIDAKLLYPAENQSWEVAMLAACSLRCPRSSSIGFVHSSVRYWDLRYLGMPPSLLNDSGLSLNPSYYASGSIQFCHELSKMGIRRSTILLVEALRSMGGSGLPEQTSGLMEILPPDSFMLEGEYCRDIKRVVLILGDYDSVVTSRVLELFSEVSTSCLATYDICLKPHPSASSQSGVIRNRPVRTVDKVLGLALEEASIVVASASTTAGLEAWISGKNVIFALDSSTPNLSPLRGLSGISFVSTAAQLENFLNSPDLLGNVAADRGLNFFENSPDLKLWRRALELL